MKDLISAAVVIYQIMFEVIPFDDCKGNAFFAHHVTLLQISETSFFLL
jgi:hypothetical protein